MSQLEMELAVVRTEGLLHMLRRAQQAHRENRLAVANDTLREADERVHEIYRQIQEIRGR